MVEVIIMPKLGFNMNEGTLVEWYKREGDSIRKGEPLFSVETDKTSMDIEATGDGVVRRLLIEAGDTLPVTLPIAVIAGADEDIQKELADAMKALGRESETCAEAPGASETGGAAQSASETGGAAQGAQTRDGGACASDTYDYDIIVVGGGPGGYVAAIKAAQLGKSVAIVEKDKFGGTCLNTGCIPTKALLRSAEALKAVQESERFGVVGVKTEGASLDLKQVQKRKQDVVGKLVGGVNGLLRGNGVTVINGEAAVKDGHTVEAAGKTVTAAYIIIATGSNAKRLPVPADPAMDVLTSTELLELNSAPRSVAVIGGGVIGVEFAYFLASIGVKVTIIEFLDRILPMVDEEITAMAEKQLNEMGIVIYTSAKVTEITASGVKFEKGGEERSAEAEKVLMAVGRGPRLDGVDCGALGIRTERGAIVTDETMRTSAESIYAIGDVNGKAMLAHTASMEGIVAVENICGKKAVMEYDKIPSAIYIQPEIACVGLTERQAKEKYNDIRVGRFPLMANGKAKVAGEERGIVKVITEAKYGEIVGVHLYCIHATDMIAESVVAMKLEATAEELAMSIHPHPTVSEVMHEAMHAAADGRAIHC